ncbi:hypothetical protein [Hymenobacter algoricola]
MKAKELKQWNEAFPVGTLVLAYPGGRDFPPTFTKIRSAAFLMSSGVAIAAVEQCSSGIGLDFIDRSTEPPAAHEQMMRRQLAEKVIKFSSNLICETVKRHLDTWGQLKDRSMIEAALERGQTEEEVMRRLQVDAADSVVAVLQTKSAQASAVVAQLQQHREGGQQHG